MERVTADGGYIFFTDDDSKISSSVSFTIHRQSCSESYFHVYVVGRQMRFQIALRSYSTPPRKLRNPNKPLELLIENELETRDCTRDFQTSGRRHDVDAGIFYCGLAAAALLCMNKPKR